MNRQISAGYQRILRANQKLAAVGKKKKYPGSEKDKEKSAAAAEAAAEAARLKTLVIEVPESLLKLIDIRRQFKDVSAMILSLHAYSTLMAICRSQAIGKAMQDWENRQPGRLMGAPSKSIFEVLKLLDGTIWEEEVQEVGAVSAA